MGRARAAPRGLDELPLFPSDEEIAHRLFGNDETRIKQFLASLPIEEARHGFPKKSVAYGGRYWPAVKAYLDRRMGLRQDLPVAAEDGQENWNETPRKRRPPNRT